MSTITTIGASDTITSSRTVLNSNFSALNTDKFETADIDTDTALTANSDTKVPSQKAVKAYIDGVGVANASVTVRGLVELATQAQVNAGMATGETGAALAVTPDTLRGISIPIVKKYISSDSPATWTKPTGLKYVIVECQGAGGDGSITSSSGGAGGGGGGYTKKLIAAASCGTTETVTIGAGGVGTGDTSFGSLLVAGNGGDASTTTGGAAGAATGGDVNVPGQAGQDAGAASYAGGKGGNSVLGFGGGGAFFPNSSATANNGQSGSGFGGGGGGGGNANDNDPDGTAGTGAGGIVIVTEYFS